MYWLAQVEFPFMSIQTQEPKVGMVYQLFSTLLIHPALHTVGWNYN